MGKLKLGPLDSVDSIDEPLRVLYTQDAETKKWHLTEVEYGFKEVKALKEENGARRISEREAKTSLEALTTAWGELKPEDVKTKLARIDELEASSKGKVPEDKLNELAEQRANAKTADLNNKLAKLTKERDDAVTLNTQYKAKENDAKVMTEVRTLAGGMGFAEKSYNDPMGPLSLLSKQLFDVDATGKVIAKEGSGFPAGTEVKDVLASVLENHPYLSKTSTGGGAGGSNDGSGKGGTQNVFKQNDMGVRAKLQQSNPGEYTKQLEAAKSSGWVKSEWDDYVAPKKS